MATIKQFEDIEAWQTARLLTRTIYGLTRQRPWASDLGLRDQICRAAVSVMSNIAEGFESDDAPQFVRYLGYAKASAGEVRAQLYVALDSGYIDQQTFDSVSALAVKCSRQIHGFISYLRGYRASHRIADDGWVYDVQDATNA